MNVELDINRILLYNFCFKHFYQKYFQKTDFLWLVGLLSKLIVG